MARGCLISRNHKDLKDSTQRPLRRISLYINRLVIPACRQAGLCNVFVDFVVKKTTFDTASTTKAFILLINLFRIYQKLTKV